MKTLLEKLVDDKLFYKSCLTAKWLSAGYSIDGSEYEIESHARKYTPEEDKGFNIILSEPDRFLDWYVRFAYGKYKIGALLPLWTSAAHIMTIWLETIVLGRTLGVSFDEEGDDLHLFAQKIDDRYTNFIFFSCIDWQIAKKPKYQKTLSKRAFHIKIETKKLVGMFYSSIQKYITHAVDNIDKNTYCSTISLKLCQSKIIEKYLGIIHRK